MAKRPPPPKNNKKKTVPIAKRKAPILARKAKPKIPVLGGGLAGLGGIGGGPGMMP